MYVEKIHFFISNNFLINTKVITNFFSFYFFKVIDINLFKKKDLYLNDF